MTNSTSTLHLSPEQILQPIEFALPTQTVLVDRSKVGADETQRLKHNLLGLARSSDNVRSFVSHLSNKGFFLVDHTQGVSRFEHLSDHSTFAQFFKDDSLQLRNGMFYSIEKPSLNVGAPRLLVVFSSIADYPLNASISRRMFFKNFPTIAKYVPKNTYILRIADIGSVLGSFYLNSNFDSDFTGKTQNLIQAIAKELSVQNSDIVLYGASKGATGAFYHGVTGSYAAVAVDPIVSDKYYLHEKKDAHFVEGNFPSYKEAVFSTLLNEVEPSSPIHVITSPSSEQYQYIDQLLSSHRGNRSLMLYRFSNPNISTHTDVGPQTINFVTAMINNLFYGIESKGSQDYAC